MANNRTYNNPSWSTSQPSEPHLNPATPRPGAGGDFTYDVFISYSHSDKEWVWGELLPRLEGAGLRVCIDDRDFEIGVPSLVNMERAVDYSRHTLIVLTPAWVESAWTEFESLLAGTADPAGRRRKLIPLLLSSCETPPRIAMLTYANFTQPHERIKQFSRLLEQLQSTAKVVSLPTEELPPFIAGPPIMHPRCFFGHERELKRLFNLWKHRPLQNAAIIGPLRSGKTSLLMYIKHITAATPPQLRPGQRSDWLPVPEGYRWIFVDFQDPRMGSREKLLRYLLEQMGLPAPSTSSVANVQTIGADSEKKTRNQKRLLRQILTSRFNEEELRTLCFDLDVDYDDLSGAGRAGKARELLLYFERHGRISELVETVCRLRPDASWDDTPEVTKESPLQRIPPEQVHSERTPCELDYFIGIVAHNLRTPTVILLDEIGIALQRYLELDNSFWEGLRSLATNQVEGNLAFVLTAQEPPDQLARHSGIGSPFFNIFGYTVTLGPLAEVEARELIASAPIPFPAGDVDWIIAQSARWPLLLQILCRERLITLEDNEPGDDWREDGLRQMAPFRHLLESL